MPEHVGNIAYCHSCGAPMDVSAVAPFTNVECPQCGKHTRVKREFGPYTLMRRHAIGGMSMVFVAHDNTLDREVALKILSEEFSADERRISAFEEEARITASFSHPNVVRVLTTGRAFERFYIAMEFVPGGHFEHQIRERGKIPEVELLPLAIEVAQGLKAAHAAGLIHRDVKPGNILLDAEGHAKLVDFGLALVTQGGKAQATELWATPYYVPPETVEGHPEDFRSDIYALGATLYHALAGKPSCGEETMATDVLREAKKKVVPLSAADPTISTETCHIVEKAMAYSPADRFHSYDELISSLAVSLSHVKSGRAEASGTSASRRAGKKRRELILAGTGILALIGTTATAIWWLNRPKPEPVPIVATPPAAPPVAPPATPDHSVEIAREYREARAAMDARNFEDAASRFRKLLENPDVQEPTRSWAGLEAVLAHFLAGRPADARTQAAAILQHLRSIAPDARRIGGGIEQALAALDDLQPLAPPAADVAAGGAEQVVSTMLAGLKNWEQGMIEPAAAAFRAAAAATLPADEAWAAVYQKIAADYLADNQVLTGPLFSSLPADKAGCEAAIDELNSVLATLKTRGRARFNVRAWQLDIARHAKLLETAATTTPASDAPAATPPLAGVLARLAEFSGTLSFEDASAYLHALPADPQGATRASLLAITTSATAFLTDLRQDLAAQAVSADLQLKSGEAVSRVAVNAQGALTATASTGQSRACQWTDFPPEALIALHRVVVRNPKNESERLRRHECAIAFDWLAGNRERALAAAAALARSSPDFKLRWDELSAGLPK